ncbi:MAG: coiled-coil protein [Candidatus Thorarchaeota archaeon]
MTEAAEAKPEDVEFLRAKLRELKVQARDELEVLRRDRDQMREYKTIRDDHNKEVRGLIESVKAEREERDRINKEISEAKDRRTAIHAQLKSVYDEIRELRSNLVGSPSTDQRRMMRRVEELEWRQQTDQLTRDEELSIVEEIAKIEAKLVKIGQEKEKQDRISELRRLARKLKEEASDAHEKVIELSEKSQIHHQEVVRIRPQLEEYKKSADTAHKNFVEWLKKVKDGETKLKDLRTQIEDTQGKLRKYTVEKRDIERQEIRDQQKAQERERAEEAVEKLQSGKRLTFDEFILAQRQVTDDKKKKPKKRSRKQEEDDLLEELAELETEIKPVSKSEGDLETTETQELEQTPDEFHSNDKTE